MSSSTEGEKRWVLLPLLLLLVVVVDVRIGTMRAAETTDDVDGAWRHGQIHIDNTESLPVSKSAVRSSRVVTPSSAITVDKSAFDIGGPRSRNGKP